MDFLYQHQYQLILISSKIICNTLENQLIKMLNNTKSKIGYKKPLLSKSQQVDLNHYSSFLNTNAWLLGINKI